MGHSDDGLALLTSGDIEDLLRAAVVHAGGDLGTWSLDHVDANPGQSTTATYRARVLWPYGIRNELIGVSARSMGPTGADSNAEIFADGDRAVAVWLYPNDPNLPGLARAAYRESMAEIVNQANLIEPTVAPEQIELSMIGYRPRRRAVIKMTISAANTTATFFVKVLRSRDFVQTVSRQRMLRQAGLPTPQVLLTTDDNILVMDAMKGTPLAQALFEETPPIEGEQLIELLDRLPKEVAGLERRMPWTAALAHYSAMVANAIPDESERLEWLTRKITAGLQELPSGMEPTHGDFHEGQIFVSQGHICGLIDVDTIGPGRRVDDLACMLAHLSTVQHMNAQQQHRLEQIIRDWTKVFDLRVDPLELRLRAAAVIISLATGPYRGQEPGWLAASVKMIDSADALVRQVY